MSLSSATRVSLNAAFALSVLLTLTPSPFSVPAFTPASLALAFAAAYAPNRLTLAAGLLPLLQHLLALSLAWLSLWFFLAPAALVLCILGLTRYGHHLTALLLVNATYLGFKHSETIREFVFSRLTGGSGGSSMTTEAAPLTSRPVRSCCDPDAAPLPSRLSSTSAASSPAAARPTAARTVDPPAAGTAAPASGKGDGNDVVLLTFHSTSHARGSAFARATNTSLRVALVYIVIVAWLVTRASHEGAESIGFKTLDAAPAGLASAPAAPSPSQTWTADVLYTVPVPHVLKEESTDAGAGSCLSPLPRKPAPHVGGAGQGLGGEGFGTAASAPEDSPAEAANDTLHGRANPSATSASSSSTGSHASSVPSADPASRPAIGWLSQSAFISAVVRSLLLTLAVCALGIVRTAWRRLLTEACSIAAAYTPPLAVGHTCPAARAHGYRDPRRPSQGEGPDAAQDHAQGQQRPVMPLSLRQSSFEDARYCLALGSAVMSSLVARVEGALTAAPASSSKEGISVDASAPAGANAPTIASNALTAGNPATRPIPVQEPHALLFRSGDEFTGVLMALALSARKKIFLSSCYIVPYDWENTRVHMLMSLLNHLATPPAAHHNGRGGDVDGDVNGDAKDGDDVVRVRPSSPGGVEVCVVTDRSCTAMLWETNLRLRYPHVQWRVAGGRMGTSFFHAKALVVDDDVAVCVTSGNLSTEYIGSEESIYHRDVHVVSLDTSLARAVTRELERVWAASEDLTSWLGFRAPPADDPAAAAAPAPSLPAPGANTAEVKQRFVDAAEIAALARSPTPWTASPLFAASPACPASPASPSSPALLRVCDAGGVRMVWSPPYAQACDTALHEAVQAASRRIWISTGQFAPSPAWLELLTAKARAGVDVQIFTCSFAGAPLFAGARALAAAAGVRVFSLKAWEDQEVHAKAYWLDDDLWMGSANLTSRSLEWDEEVMCRFRLGPAQDGIPESPVLPSLLSTSSSTSLVASSKSTSPEPPLTHHATFYTAPDTLADPLSTPVTYLPPPATLLSAVESLFRGLRHHSIDEAAEGMYEGLRGRSTLAAVTNNLVRYSF